MINEGTARLRTVSVTGSTGVQNTYGGIYNSDGALLILEEFSSVTGNNGINLGGGITNEGALVLRQVTFYGNRGNMGGALANLGGHVAVISSSFSSNHATSQGGAYSNYGTTSGSMAFWATGFGNNTADIACDTYFDIDEWPNACVD